jgi:UPF0755 protein
MRKCLVPKLLKATIILISIGCLTYFGLISYLDSWSLAPINTPGEVILEIKPGMSLRSIASSLENKGVINNKTLFAALIRLRGDYKKVQAGSYQFKGLTTPADIIKKIKSGDVFIPVVLQVTIPEGFTIKMLNDRLAAKNVGKRDALEKISRDVKFIRSLGINASSLEGFTYPATYNFDVMPNAQEFYKKTIKTFFEKIPADYESSIAKVGLNLTEAVTFASLIELETMREEEKPIISEVIWARLKKGEPLGIDAAIIYGIENYDGDLKWKDLKNKKNRYNTRVHRGLPPGPIGAVSKSSLVAVLNPTNLGYYYYVLDSKDPTRHLFSKTLAEHNAKVRKLVNSTRSPTIRSNNGKEDSQ